MYEAVNPWQSPKMRMQCNIARSFPLVLSYNLPLALALTYSITCDSQKTRTPEKATLLDHRRNHSLNDDEDDDDDVIGHVEDARRSPMRQISLTRR